MRQYLLIGALCCAAFSARAATRVALVSTCGGEAGADVLALAEEKLSQLPDIVLVERREVERVLQEQKLSVCGLSGYAQALAVGKLLGVEVFVALESFPGATDALGVVAFDAASGVKLWDATLPGGGPGKTAAGIVTAVQDACKKRVRPTTSLRTICLMPVRNAELPRSMDIFCESVGQLLERRLLGSASLTVLERERLDQINRERLLVANEAPNNLLPSLTLLELEFSRAGESNGVNVSVLLTDAAGMSLGRVQAVGKTEQAADLVTLLIQKLMQTLKAAPALATVDRPREAQRFRQEASFFIEHGLFAKSLQAVEAAYALDPTDKESRPLLAHALFSAANDLLDHPVNLERAFGMANRGADLTLQIWAESAVGDVLRYSRPAQEGAFASFLMRSRGVGTDDESRRKWTELQSKYRHLQINIRDDFLAKVRFDMCNLHWFIEGLALSEANAATWTSDTVKIVNRILVWMDKSGESSMNGYCYRLIIDSILFRISQPSNPTTDYYRLDGLDWRLTDAEKERLQVPFTALIKHPDPLHRFYGLASKLAATVRQQPASSREITAHLEKIKQLAKETIANPPGQKPDNYRTAVYQVWLNTIDILTDPALRRYEYQELFEFMLVRREYVHFVALAAIEQQTFRFAEFQSYGSILPHEQTPGDAILCTQNLERIVALLDAPDCRRLAGGPPELWRKAADQQLARLRQKPIAVPWSASRLLYDGPSALQQPHVVNNAVWGLEFPPGKTSATELQLVRVPLDGSPVQRYSHLPTDGPPDRFYATVVNDGIVVFPPDAGAVNHLTETNGLPSSQVSVVACCDGKLYAGIGHNDGHHGTAGYLIACELATGRVTVLASSLRREKLSALDNVSPPFFIRKMVADPARHRVIFSVDIGQFKAGTPSTGLWSVDTQNDKLTYLLPLNGICEWIGPIHNNEFLFTRRLQVPFGNVYEVLAFDLVANKAKLWTTTAWPYGPNGDHAFIHGDPVYKISWSSYPPHLILDGWLWMAYPFHRIPANRETWELLPSFTKSDSLGYGQLNYLELIESSRQILAGTGNQLWLLTLPDKSAKEKP